MTNRFRRVSLLASLLAILVVPANAQDARALPNHELTPGKARQLSTETVCTTRWGLDRRMVTEAMKRHVLAAYGLTWAERTGVEIDHLIPRSLAGADDILNLFPQPLAGEWGARKKDVLELTLGRLVCAGGLSLSAAQKAIRSDWIAAYRKYVQKLADNGLAVRMNR